MLFVLDPNERAVGVLDNSAPFSCRFFNDRFTENINDNLSILEFEVSNDHETADLIQVEGYIIYTDLDNKQKLFIVKEIQETHDTVKTKTIYCEAAATGELVGSIIRPGFYASFSLENILNIVLQGTSWGIGTIEFSNVKDIEFSDYITSLEALHQVVNLFEGEMEFEVIFNGSQIVKRQVNVLQRRGNETGKIFEYTKNLNSIQRVEDTRNLVTALIGIGKADSEGNVLTLTGHTPAVVPNGYALINDYVENKNAFQRYNKNGHHIFGVFKDDKATSKTELYNNTLAKLQELSKPLLTYTCDVVSLERLTEYEHESVRIGDTILVKDFTYDSPIVLSARVVELVRSLSNPLNDVVTLGDYIPINIQGKNSELEDLKNLVFNKQNIWSYSGEIASESLIEAREAAAQALAAAEKALEAEQVAQQAEQDALNARQASIDAEQAAIDAARQATNADQNALNAQQEALNAKQAALDADQKALDAQATADDALRKAQLVDELDRKLVDIDLKIADWASDNDTTMIDGAKIYTGTVSADKINARGLNINNQFIVDNYGNVTFSGNLSGASGSFSGSVTSGGSTQNSTLSSGILSFSTSRGANLNIYAQGDEAGLYFTSPSNYSGSITFGSIGDIYINNDDTLYLNSSCYFSDSASFNGRTSFNNTTYFNTQPISQVSETGFCGLGGYCSYGSGVQWGTGVNFRTRKNYTPSSVTLNSTSSTITGNPLITNINTNGFWMYFQGQGTGLKYWRGTYTA